MASQSSFPTPARPRDRDTRERIRAEHLKGSFKRSVQVAHPLPGRTRDRAHSAAPDGLSACPRDSVNVLARRSECCVRCSQTAPGSMTLRPYPQTCCGPLPEPGSTTVRHRCTTRSQTSCGPRPEPGTTTVRHRCTTRSQTSCGPRPEPGTTTVLHRMSPSTPAPPPVPVPLPGPIGPAPMPPPKPPPWTGWIAGCGSAREASKPDPSGMP
jgi:hypothetical protein